MATALVEPLVGRRNDHAHPALADDALDAVLPGDDEPGRRLEGLLGPPLARPFALVGVGERATVPPV